MCLDPIILPAEEWRPIPGFGGVYEVSNLGRVRRLAHGRNTWAGKVLKPHDNSRGYVNVRLGVSRQNSRDYAIHVLVAVAFIGPRPPGYDVDHLDGVRTNNVVTNLEWVTHAENIRRAYVRHGGGWTEARGEANGNARLRVTDVLTIRTLQGRQPASTIAATYGIDVSRVYKIWNRTAWKHL